jgi:hypothetical protein
MIDMANFISRKVNFRNLVTSVRTSKYGVMIDDEAKTISLLDYKLKPEMGIGRGGIRTPGPRKGTSVFKTDAFSRSATLPG